MAEFLVFLAVLCACSLIMSLPWTLEYILPSQRALRRKRLFDSLPTNPYRTRAELEAGEANSRLRLLPKAVYCKDCSPDAVPWLAPDIVRSAISDSIRRHLGIQRTGGKAS